MNFLQLTQRLARECGVAGTGPSSVVGQSNEAARLVNYVADAWVEIQAMHDVWTFMQADWIAAMPASTSQITLADAGIAATFKRWKSDSLRGYRTAVGTDDDNWLVEWDWPVFRDTYRFGSQTPGRPSVFAMRPADESLQLGPVMDDAYTVYGEYYKRPVRLAADADTPVVDDSLHMAIVYKAMMFYGLYEAASEVMARGERGLAALATGMERRYLPDITVGDAWA